VSIQTIVYMMNESASYKRVATGQNLSLGQLIRALEAVPDKSLPVVMGAGLTPVSLDSYRGYYRDLAIQWSDWERGTKDDLGTVGKLLARLKAAVGEAFEGYKGGEFTMNEETPLWCAEYGRCGEAIHAVKVSAECVRLTTVPDAD
jgi:hypothetical protein